MFVRIAETKIFRNQFGDLVTNGAMGLGRAKEIDGVETVLVRSIFISPM